MSPTNYQQCTRCVMDTTDPDIIFDVHGYCNHCKEYLARTSQLIYQGKKSDEELKKMVNQIKTDGKNKEYDCVVGISGGIDSCYVAYVAKLHGLRVLAVHLDNGWNSEIAVKNIKHVVSKLGFDYQSYVLDWEEFKALQIAFLKASIVDAEVPTDMAIPAALHKVAAENNIKYVLSGGNYATEGILPTSWGYNPKDMTLFRAVVKKFATRKIKNYPTFGFWDEVYFKFVKGIKIKYPLNLVPFTKDGAMKILKEELNWQYYGGKHYESKFTGFLQSYILPVKFNQDYRKATLSTQICAGDKTREEALKELESLPYNVEKAEIEKKYVCKKLGLSMEEFEKIMSLPPKIYRDYPNNEKRLEKYYNLYRKMFNNK